MGQKVHMDQNEKLSMFGVTHLFTHWWLQQKGCCSFYNAHKKQPSHLWRCFQVIAHVLLWTLKELKSFVHIKTFFFFFHPIGLQCLPMECGIRCEEIMARNFIWHSWCRSCCHPIATIRREGLTSKLHPQGHSSVDCMMALATCVPIYIITFIVFSSAALSTCRCYITLHFLYNYYAF